MALFCRRIESSRYTKHETHPEPTTIKREKVTPLKSRNRIYSKDDSASIPSNSESESDIISSQESMNDKHKVSRRIRKATRRSNKGAKKDGDLGMMSFRAVQKPVFYGDRVESDNLEMIGSSDLEVGDSGTDSHLSSAVQDMNDDNNEEDRMSSGAVRTDERDDISDDRMLHDEEKSTEEKDEDSDHPSLRNNGNYSDSSSCTEGSEQSDEERDREEAWKIAEEAVSEQVREWRHGG